MKMNLGLANMMRLKDLKNEINKLMEIINNDVDMFISTSNDLEDKLSETSIKDLIWIIYGDLIAWDDKETTLKDIEEAKIYLDELEKYPKLQNDAELKDMISDIRYKLDMLYQLRSSI